MICRCGQSLRGRRGLTMIEAMILMVIMSAIAVATGIALQSLVRVPTMNNRTLVISNLLIDKIEQLKALGFTTLATTANGSDQQTIDNITYTRTWTLTTNPGSAYDSNFIQISVSIGNQTITTAVTKQ
jgi:type II secretory pathway pseudopilin PulG